MRPWPSFDEIAATGRFVAHHQRSDGAVPWAVGQKIDPWDHVQCAMALAATGQYDAAKRAFRYLAQTQGEDGSWPAASTPTGVIDATRDSNHAAYIATGLWYLHRARPANEFLVELWPTLERAIEFVLRLQNDSGTIWWARDELGTVWPAPLITGCASIHGSLVCAARIAALLGRERPAWSRARERLAAALRDEQQIFFTAPLVEPPGRYSMDWYYPVLGGAVRGQAGYERLVEGRREFLGEGVGCRCVRDRPWYTVAETCELIIALDTCGLTDRARDLFEWVHTLRQKDGSYWTGITHPDGQLWPVERLSWTAATVILAAVTLAGDAPTSRFFRELDADGSEPPHGLARARHPRALP